MEKQERVFLNHLLGKPLQKAFRLAETELFCFGFGDIVKETVTSTGQVWTVPQYWLNVQCPFELVKGNHKSSAVSIDGDTETAVFQSAVAGMPGSRVRQIQWLEGNGLALFLGEDVLVLHPQDPGEEAWRFFETEHTPHLVVCLDRMDF